MKRISFTTLQKYVLWDKCVKRQT